MTSLAWTLEDLRPEDRKLLAGIGNVTAGEWRACRSDYRRCLNEPDWPDRLEKVGVHLAGLGGWKAAALAHLAHEMPEDWVTSPDRRQLTRFAYELVEMLDPKNKKAPADCGRLYTSVREYASTGHGSALFPAGNKCLKAAQDSLPYVPVSGYFLDSRRLPHRSSDWDWNRYDLLAVRADVRDKLEIVTLNEDSTEAEYIQARVSLTIQTEDSPSVHARQTKVFLVPIAHLSRVTTRLVHPNGALPEVRTLPVGDSTPYETGPRQQECVNWDVRLPSGPADPDVHYDILFDGELMTKDTVTVAAPMKPGDLTQHNLAVVRRSASAVQFLADVPIDSGTLSPTGCFPIRLDLTKSDPSKGDVAVLGPTVDASCLQSGVDAQTVRRHMGQLLGEFGLTTRDPRAMADAVTQYADLVTSLSTLGAAPVGASPGRRDTTRQLGDGAAETLRQGFTAILSVGLTCNAQRSTAFALRTTLVDLAEFGNTRDLTTGIDISKDVRTDVQVFDGVADLENAIRASLSKVYLRPYVLLDAAPSAHGFFTQNHESVRVFVPGRGVANAEDTAGEGYVVRVEARRFEREEDAFHVCGVLAAASRLHGEGPGREIWDQLPHARSIAVRRGVAPKEGTESAYDIAWEPYLPGRYLLRATLEREGVPEAVPAFRCTDSADGPLKVELAAGYSLNIAPPMNSAARSESLAYSHFMISVSAPTAPHSPFLLGVAFGFANALHTQSAPPSWQLSTSAPTPAPTFDSSGGLPLSWTRRSVQVGPQFGYFAAAPFCVVPDVTCSRPQRSIGLLGRVIPVLDVGGFDTSGIPAGLQPLAATGRGVSFEISTFLQAGITGRLDQQKEVHLLVNLGLLSWPDYFRSGDRSSSLRTLSYEPNVTLGLLLGGEVDP
jgi:hypothetical protein